VSDGASLGQSDTHPDHRQACNKLARTLITTFLISRLPHCAARFMRLARHKNRKSPASVHRLLIGNLAAQLIIILNMHLFALASRIGHPTECVLRRTTAPEYQCTADAVPLSLLWALRRKLHDIHKNISPCNA
jgi:hypothetical protein